KARTDMPIRCHYQPKVERFREDQLAVAVFHMHNSIPELNNVERIEKIGLVDLIISLGIPKQRLCTILVYKQLTEAVSFITSPDQTHSCLSFVTALKQTFAQVVEHAIG